MKDLDEEEGLLSYSPSWSRGRTRLRWQRIAKTIEEHSLRLLSMGIGIGRLDALFAEW
jgi:hypothetical protein